MILMVALIMPTISISAAAQQGPIPFYGDGTYEPKTGINSINEGQINCVLWGATNDYFNPPEIVSSYETVHGAIDAQGWITADFSGDGFCDIFMGFAESIEKIPFRMLFYEPETGTFVDVSHLIKENVGQLGTRKITTADLNNDGISDFIANSHTHYEENRQPDAHHLDIILSDATGTWRQINLAHAQALPPDPSLNPGYFHGHAVGDVDNDGDVDIYLCEGNGLFTSKMFMNNGLGVFEERSAYDQEAIDRGMTVYNSHTAELYDLNGDGFQDLLQWYNGQGVNSYVIYGDGSGVFKGNNIDTFEDPRFGSNLSILDFDALDLNADGRVDLILLLEDMANAYVHGQWDMELGVMLNMGNDSEGKVIWDDISEVINSGLRAQGMNYAPEGVAGWLDYWFLYDLNHDGVADLIPQEPFGRPCGACDKVFGDFNNFVLLGNPEGPSFRFVPGPYFRGPVQLDGGPGRLLSWQVDSVGHDVDSWIIRHAATPWVKLSEEDMRVDTISVSGLNVESFMAPQYEMDRYYRVSSIDINGIESPLSNLVMVEANSAPLAVLTASTAQGQAPYAIDFDASFSTDPNGDALTFSWDFGDGATGSGETVSHTYTAAGEYSVVLTASDGVLTGTDSLTVSIASGVDTESFELPETFVLQAAYPNPFNPTTTVTYGLPAASEVRITATDLLGRQVATLVADGVKTAGYHTVQFNADGLASGTYLIRMEAGDFVAIQQVVLLK